MSTHQTEQSPAEAPWLPTYAGQGTPRPDPVTDDERGPDSVECADAKYGTGWWHHSHCFLDYSDIGPRGVVCGCSCHDVPPTGA